MIGVVLHLGPLPSTPGCRIMALWSLFSVSGCHKISPAQAISRTLRLSKNNTGSKEYTHLYARNYKGPKSKSSVV